MNLPHVRFLLLLCSGPLFASNGNSADLPLRRIIPGTDPARATVRVHASERSPNRVPKEITGKFAEHLGFNIYNGMDAQILRNPTFADYPFWNGQTTPDGVTKFEIDDKRINDQLRQQATRFGWPESDLADLVQARADSLACFWSRLGSRDVVQPSPDTGPNGGRAQRIQVKAAGQGIAQWTWLPLHRQREYEFEIMARSPELGSLTVALWRQGHEQPLTSARVTGLSDKWAKLRGTLRVPADGPPAISYKFTVAADSPGQFVIRHILLRPADAISGADFDVVRLLRESHLPLLRWPGGNFVSTYHWRDGVGSIEQRPTKPNYAWGAIEPNTFGTDEFMAFCRAVGCEPMICINGGSGSPDEAAQWIEYCNGAATSPMGRLRAANGQHEPFHVRRWEVGNELWGHWQMHWTTASGYVDRYKEFARAMLRADPSIELYVCGAPVMSGKQWNDTLIHGIGAALARITDHPLIGGSVPPSTEPLDVYRDFMAVPEVLQHKWAGLRDDLFKGGVTQPKLAVTELQLFAHLGGSSDSTAPVRLTRERFPGQPSITEAIYDVLLYHATLRLTPFIELVTHSATVNHGGGLRKERERVWANPCHYAQGMFAAFAESTLVPVDVETALESAPMVLPDLRHPTNAVSFGAIDALAAIRKDGILLISLVHRGSTGPIRVTVELPGLEPAGAAEVETLTANAPWEGNSMEKPEAIKPVVSTVNLQGSRLDLRLAPYTVVCLRVHPSR